MKRMVIKKSLLIATAVFAVAGVTPVAVMAQSTRAQEVQTQAEEQRSAVRQTTQQRQQEAQLRVNEIKQKVEQRRATIKQNVCERRQQRLATVIPRLATGATSVKTALDSIYDRVQGFYKNGQLTVDNYDELTTAIDTAKTDSEATLDVVKEYKFELDCDNPSVGEQLESYRLAVKQSKEALKVYRDKLIDLVSALRAEAAENTDADKTDGSSNDAENGGESNDL